jgi:hypothetical protein
MEKKENY